VAGDLRSRIVRTDVEFAISIINDDTAASEKAEFLREPTLNFDYEEFAFDESNSARALDQIGTTSFKRNAKNELSVNLLDRATN